jgi:hypothetical protein
VLIVFLERACSTPIKPLSDTLSKPVTPPPHTAPQVLELNISAGGGNLEISGSAATHSKRAQVVSYVRGHEATDEGGGLPSPLPLAAMNTKRNTSDVCARGRCDSCGAKRDTSDQGSGSGMRDEGSGMPAYVSIRQDTHQDTSAYARIRHHTSSYDAEGSGLRDEGPELSGSLITLTAATRPASTGDAARVHSLERPGSQGSYCDCIVDEVERERER